MALIGFEAKKVENTNLFHLTLSFPIYGEALRATGKVNSSQWAVSALPFTVGENPNQIGFIVDSLDDCLSIINLVKS